MSLVHMQTVKLLISQWPEILGPVVQSIVSLTSSLVVKMLNVLVSTVSNSVIFAENISAIFNDQSFNDTLTINEIISFEQLDPEKEILLFIAIFYSSQ